MGLQLKDQIEYIYEKQGNRNCSTEHHDRIICCRLVLKCSVECSLLNLSLGFLSLKRFAQITHWNHQTKYCQVHQTDE
jgi:hypothetical protein